MTEPVNPAWLDEPAVAAHLERLTEDAISRTCGMQAAGPLSLVDALTAIDREIGNETEIDADALARVRGWTLRALNTHARLLREAGE